ncbi:unannotated protein [freshwater metagenome]|uniref:Unannotated protein n=1 Tax=freshwater metagenome TaxID=449393 RepID=A0A6J7D2Y0_9ZZZZ|nr:hypothetical protein [Actinomycetota bacterium]
MQHQGGTSRLPPLRRPPHLRGPQGNDRHATWLELFFDLVIVAAVISLASRLVKEPDLGGVLRFVALFIPIAWAWMGFTYYANRFDSDDLAYRLTVSASMLAVAAMATSVGDLSDAGTQRFALAYSAVAFLRLLLYARARRHVPEARRAIDLYLAGFGLGFLFWIISAFVPPPWRYVLWGIGLFAEFATPLLGWGTISSTPIDRAHLVERFGLFTIIVLGESVLSVVLGVQIATWSSTTVAVASASFVGTVAIWWTYFDFEGGHQLKPGLWGFVTSYGHLAIWLSTAALAAAAKLGIKHSHEVVHVAGERWIAVGAAGVFLATIGIFHLADRDLEPKLLSLVRLSAIAALVALGVAGSHLHWPVLTWIIAAILIVGAVVEGSSRRQVLLRNCGQDA